jgi:hypothetical protein
VRTLGHLGLDAGDGDEQQHGGREEQRRTHGVCCVCVLVLLLLGTVRSVRGGGRRRLSAAAENGWCSGAPANQPGRGPPRLVSMQMTHGRGGSRQAEGTRHGRTSSTPAARVRPAPPFVPSPLCLQ